MTYKLPPLKETLHTADNINKFGDLEDKKVIAVLDLELTCWDTVPVVEPPPPPSEIIEIGIAFVDATTLELIDTATINCKPLYNIELSDFCKALTGIKQREVDQSANLVVQFSKLEDRFPILKSPKEFIWAAWGNDPTELQYEMNKRTFKEQQKRYFDPRFINLQLIAKKLSLPRGLAKCLKAVDVRQELPVHRALPDALSTYNILHKLRLSTLDASISSGRTYLEAIAGSKSKILTEFIQRSGLDTTKSQKLLNYTNWDFTKALNIVKLLSDK